MSGNQRTAAEIVDELYRITVEMTCKPGDADFLIESIDKRQELMDEYDRRRNSGEVMFATKQEQEQSAGTIAKIAELDKSVFGALEKLRDETKQKLKTSQANRKVLGYTDSAMSGPGSYMNIKK
jgi:hypothetical protein